MHLRRHQVGGDRNIALAACQNGFHGSAVIAAVDSNAIAATADQLDATVQVATGFLDADDVRQVRQSGDCLRQDIAAGAAWHVIQNLRNINFFRNFLKVLVQAFLTRLVVVARDDQSRVGAGIPRQRIMVDAGLDPGAATTAEIEGAFYAPKLEWHLTDAIGRTWQCGTLQLDYVLPERLDASYVGEDGERHRPVMLHRAILGSFERFIGMLIENHAGALPAWLAPEHVVVCCISESSADYAQSVAQNLKKMGFRASSDLRGEKITRKIREHSMQKVPYILVVGEKERENGAVAVRARGGVDLGVMPVADFSARLKQEIDSRQ